MLVISISSKRYLQLGRLSIYSRMNKSQRISTSIARERVKRFSFSETQNRGQIESINYKEDN